MLAGWIDCGFVTMVEDEMRFWNGSKIYLCRCKDEKDRNNLLIDEVTHFTDVIYRFLRNRVRMVGITTPEKSRKIFPRIVCLANPGGIGHQFFKATFIDGVRPMQTYYASKSEGGMLRLYILARLEDNPSMASAQRAWCGRCATVTGA